MAKPLALAGRRLASLAAQATDARDSTFLLATDDPDRSPSPFIGNGRIGLVIPPLGLGAATVLMAGLYENGPGDVPRIVGRARLERHRAVRRRALARHRRRRASVESLSPSRSTCAPATARTRYDWVRRRAAHLGAGRDLRLAGRAAPGRDPAASSRPSYAGRLRVRFALAGLAAAQASGARDTGAGADPTGGRPTSGIRAT